MNSKRKIRGLVIHGNKRGRELGFPTANIFLEGLEEIDPGVYAGRVTYKKREYLSGVYIHGHKPLLEAHILDFDGDLYGENLQVELEEKIRGAKKYDTDQELIAAISADIVAIQRHYHKQ